jgi:hypothetical protein
MSDKKHIPTIVILSCCSIIFGGPLRQSDTTLTIDVSQVRLKEYVESLCSTPRPRCYNDTSTLNSVASSIKKTFESFGYQTREQPFEVRGRIYKNIIAVAGKGNSRKIVVGAHYDVAGIQKGADDNASGVAGLLELAMIVKQNEGRLKSQIEFVAYALEEPPNFGTASMGSYIHARALSDSNCDVECMISLEMIGYFSDKPKSQQYPLGILGLFYPDRGNFIAAVSTFGSGAFVHKIEKVINERTSIRCCSLLAPAWVPGINFSDHRNYLGFHFKALMITDSAFYRNHGYHTTSDLIETLDFNRMAEVVKGVCWFLLG